MRPTILLAPLLALGTACARPVLYYPTPESAGIKPEAAAVLPGVPAPAPAAGATSMSPTDLEARRLLVPVAGVAPSKLEDTFGDGRDGGERAHHAIDILAPRGTPILSADDGRILRMTSNTLGGITMYTADTDNRFVYYYAHMDHYNDAMSPGRSIVKGDTLGFVGTTGNAPKDTPHLHFQVMRWPADGKYWNGEPIDPYEALGGLPHTAAGKRLVGQPHDD